MNKKRSLPKTLIMIAIVLIVLVVGCHFLVRYLEREQWIALTVDTTEMAAARSSAGKLTVRSQLPQRVEKEGITLYGALLYPDMHTLVCTISKPKQYEDFAFYAISEAGSIYPGWYNPDSMGEASSERYDVVKCFFEDLITNRIVKINVVDKSKIVGIYDPETCTDQVSFDLTLIARDAESSKGSSKSSSVIESSNP